MAEVDSWNRLPVSQLARLHLQKVGEKPDPSLPYLLQLALWAVSHGKLEVQEPGNPSAAEDFREVLDYMLANKPDWCMDYLLNEGPDEGDPSAKWVDPKEFGQQKSPEAAAAYVGERLMEALDDRIPAKYFKS